LRLQVHVGRPEDIEKLSWERGFRISRYKQSGARNTVMPNQGFPIETPKILFYRLLLLGIIARIRFRIYLLM